MISTLLLAAALIVGPPSRSIAAETPDAGTAPTDLTCPDRCRLHAEDVLEQCVAAGTDDASCVRLAEDAFTDCVDAGCDPDPEGCELGCRHRAHRLYRACLADGGAPDDCAARARAAVGSCVAAQCEPPTCAERCDDRARALHDRCLAAGIDPARCDTLARGYRALPLGVLRSHDSPV
jgi:hypothetical protein